MRYKNRYEAGRELAKSLKNYQNAPNAVVLGLPRGGIPVAYEVAKALNLPLDVFVVRKLGAPRNEEFAIGAVGPDGALYIDQDTVKYLTISNSELENTIAKEKLELEKRYKIYENHRKKQDLPGKTIILVDDGIATGSTMLAAIKALRASGVKEIIVAVPVCPSDSRLAIEGLVDEFICPYIPESFSAVGQFYEDFTQTEHAEVCELLNGFSLNN